MHRLQAALEVLDAPMDHIVVGSEGEFDDC